MKILCAVDFSDASTTAGRAAARLAAALRADLHLLHAEHLPSLALRPDTAARATETERRRNLLASLAAELSALSHGSVTHEVAEGLPEECILQAAETVEAPLVVIGAVGDRPTSEWNLGSVAMRVIKGSPLPVLVVREERSIERWLDERDGRLRVLVGADPHGDKAPPLGVLGMLREAGPIEVCAGHVYLPGAERTRLASDEHERELSAALLARFPAGSVERARVLPGFGRVAEHLMDLAAAEAADLVLVGTHHRRGWNRLLHGSVSLDIVASARRNTLVVPLFAAPQRREESGGLTRVLVPVDFSRSSELAVDWATRLLGADGRLQLVHVVAPYVPVSVELGAYIPVTPASPEARARDRAELERKLRELVREEALVRGVSVEVEVLDGFDPAAQIGAAARRLGSQLICMPTHGRTGISRALLGSVPQGVLRHADVPVLVLPPERSRGVS
jgi:nucleotide-binding universal stress UspA family protein